MDGNESIMCRGLGKACMVTSAVSLDHVERVVFVRLAPSVKATIRPSPWANERACDLRDLHIAASRVQPDGMLGLLPASIPPPHLRSVPPIHHGCPQKYTK